VNDPLSLANSLNRRTLRTGAEFSNRFTYRILQLAWSTPCLTHSLLSLVWFHNWRLAHVASCQPDIGAWHRLYTSALLWSQDSSSSFFIGTSYKDLQVKRCCVREKFTEWSLEVWMFKFYIKKCYCVVHVLVKRSKTFKNPIYLFWSLCEFRLTMVGFKPRTSRSTSVNVNE